MKILRHIVLLFTVVVLLLFVGCGDSGSDSDIPVYSYLEPIDNPPDLFELVFNISYDGNRPAYITFEDNAVWLIKKLGDSRISFWVQNDSTTLDIYISDTLALKADYTYIFFASNNNYDDFTNLFTMFTKLDYDYDDFEPKF